LFIDLELGSTPLETAYSISVAACGRSSRRSDLDSSQGAGLSRPDPFPAGELPGAPSFAGAPVASTVDYFGVLNEGQLRYRFPLRRNENLDAAFAAGAS
jgi:hypothetical protein